MTKPADGFASRFCRLPARSPHVSDGSRKPTCFRARRSTVQTQAGPLRAGFSSSRFACPNLDKQRGTQHGSSGPPRPGPDRSPSGCIPHPMRSTKIVATIGPASRDPEVLRRMVDAGMDVARLNFAHGDPEEHAETVALVREAAGAAGREVAVLQDIPGSKLRIG